MTVRDTRSEATAARLDTTRRLSAGQAQLSQITLQRLEAQLPWYRTLSAADKQWVSVVANAGIGSFIEWYRHPETPLKLITGIFKSAPRELIRSVSLQQTLQLLRVVVGVVEERVPDLAKADAQQELREAVLVYSREIAFAAADVYARAAEARGSWDARLEALVVDALMRGDSVDELASRSAAFGWQSEAPVHVMLGRAPRRPVRKAIDAIRRAARQCAEDALVGIQDDRLIIILGGVEDIDAAASELVRHFGSAEVVVGPEVPALAEAGTSAAAALSALRTAVARPSTPRPVHADDLLPERAMAGDAAALDALISGVFEPLESGGQLLDTVGAYLECGGSLESTARVLHVHPNTVRYRLKKIAELIGLDPTEPRAAFTIRIALVFGRLSSAGQLSSSHKPGPLHAAMS